MSEANNKFLAHEGKWNMKGPCWSKKQRVWGMIYLKVLHISKAFIFSPYLLVNFFQQLLDSSEIPSDWKKANIVPIFKKGDRTKPANYRPVSLTAVVSKMLEHVVPQIMDHLDHRKILHENQYGFRSQRSCKSQLSKLTHNRWHHQEHKPGSTSWYGKSWIWRKPMTRFRIKGFPGKCHILVYAIQR